MVVARGILINLTVLMQSDCHALHRCNRVASQFYRTARKIAVLGLQPFDMPKVFTSHHQFGYKRVRGRCLKGRYVSRRKYMTTPAVNPPDSCPVRTTFEAKTH